MLNRTGPTMKRKSRLSDTCVQKKKTKKRRLNKDDSDDDDNAPNTSSKRKDSDQESTSDEEGDDEHSNGEQLDNAGRDDEDANSQPSGDEAVKSRSRKSELYKPPTSDELNELRETETLYQSGLMRLQISELLSEVKVNDSRRSIIDSFINKLSKLLTTKREHPKHKMSDLKPLKKLKVVFPFVDEKRTIKGMFQFFAPKSVRVIGAYPLRVCNRSSLNIDIACVMPKECFQSKDHLNQRYLYKRALYLTYLASHLPVTNDLVASVKFTFDHGNRMKPTLLVKPTDKFGKRFTVVVHLAVEKGTFRLNRFHINKNNIRSSWYKLSARQADEEEVNMQQNTDEPATPHYNTWILADMIMIEQHALFSCVLNDATNIQDAIILLKVWLHQRQLDIGYHSCSGFIMTAFIVHLMQQKKINATMSSYQIVRCTLLNLANADWTTRGISLAVSDHDDTMQPIMDDFISKFDVKFLDSTGYVNLAANMSKSAFNLLKHEAQLSVNHMNAVGVDPFQVLFMTPVNFLQKFDQLLHISSPHDSLQAYVDKADMHSVAMDLCGDVTAASLSPLIALLLRALERRVRLIALKPSSNTSWLVTECPPTASSVERLTFGILHDPQHSNSLLERGPPANQPEAIEFRNFWGEKSEIRRFQDGAVCEAVVWPCDTVADRRMVIPRIIKHILNRHCSIDNKNMTLISNQLDFILRPHHSRPPGGTTAKSSSKKPSPASVDVYGTGEELHASIVASCDRLGKLLRSLNSLPLSISSVQGISPSARYAEVFPPASISSEDGECENRQLPTPDHPCPSFTMSMRVLCLLEGSGKWPEDREAVRRVKAAFYLNLAAELKDRHGLNVLAYTDHVLVSQDGYVFDVVIGYLREIQLCKTVLMPDGKVRITDTPESLALQRDLVGLPRLSSVLHGIYQQNNTYCSAVRLAKRWLSSQLLFHPYVREEAVELMMAQLYILPAPYEQPRNCLTAFLRFLRFLSTHDWQTTPLIVNLNNELTKADMIEIESMFTKDRTALPLMFIATPTDRTSQLWTKTGPSAQVLQRIARLAAESLRVCEEQLMENIRKADFKIIFRAPTSAYDVLIYLRPSYSPRRIYAIDIVKNTVTQALKSPAAYMKSDVHKYISTKSDICYTVPITDFDPVQYYLQELRAAFSELALFFHDTFGGNYIGVVWKPTSLVAKPFKVFSAQYSLPKPTESGEDVQIAPNLDGILDDFAIIGEGLVERIDVMNKPKI